MRVPVLIAALVSLALAGGCATDTRAGARITEVVPVSLANFSISIPSHIHAGWVRFAVRGRGPTMHEFNVARSDIPANRLPLAPDGTVDDENPHPGFTHVKEIEGIDIGGHGSIVVHLTPGRYVFYCNMYGHYGAGMYAATTVS